MDAFLLIKMAYEEEVSELEKEAFVGPLLKTMTNFGKGALGKFKGIFGTVRKGARPAEQTGEKAVTQAERAGESASSAMKPPATTTPPATPPATTTGAEAGADAAKPGFWRQVGSLTGLAGAPKGTIGYTLGAPLRPFFGGEGAGNVVGFGVFGGALNAAMADPGERMSAFAKGFGSGLAGGAGWQWGGTLGKGMIGRLAKPGSTGLRGNIAKVTDPKAGLDSYGKIMEYGKGQLPGLLGARTLTNTIGIGSALGSSMLLQNAAEKHVPFLNPEQGIPPGVQAGAKAVGSAFGVPGMGLTAPQMPYMNQPGANPYGTI